MVLLRDDPFAPTPTLTTKNTFIVGPEDWLEDEEHWVPPLLTLQKFESCPATFAPSLAHSLAKACETDDDEEVAAEHLRQTEGGALEVNLDGVSCIRDARARAAMALGVIPARVCFMSSSGNYVDDFSYVGEQDASLQIVVLSEEELSRRSEIELRTATFLNMDSAAIQTTNSGLLADMRLDTPDEAAFAIKLVISRATQDLHSCERCAHLLSVLTELYPDFQVCTASRRPVKFRRILLTACQDEYEKLFAKLAREGQNRHLGDLDDYIRAHQHKRCRALLVLISKLFAKKLLTVNVVEQILQDLTEPFPNSVFPLACVCYWLQELFGVLSASAKGIGVLSRTKLRLASVITKIRAENNTGSFVDITRQCGDALCMIERELQKEAK